MIAICDRKHNLTIVTGLKELFPKLDAGHQVVAAGALLEAHVRVVLQADDGKNEGMGSLNDNMMTLKYDLCSEITYFYECFLFHRPLAMQLAQPSLFDYLPHRPCPPGQFRTNFDQFCSIFFINSGQYHVNLGQS